jgi:hypothetical protein
VSALHWKTISVQGIAQQARIHEEMVTFESALLPVTHELPGDGFSRELAAVSFLTARLAPGSMPDASIWQYSSRRSRAAFWLVSG